MAFPTSATLVPTGVAPALAGITVGVYPSTNLCVTEIQRATAVGAASSLWQTVWNIEASSAYEVSFTDRMPLSTRTFSYRARHKRVGFANSAFTKIVSGKPIAMGQIANPTPTAQGGARYALAGVGLTTAGALTGNLTNLPVAIRKTVRYPHTQSLAAISTQKWQYNNEDLFPATINVTQFLRMGIVVPVGVTLKSIAARLLRKASASTATVKFYQVNTTGTFTTLATLTKTTSSTYANVSSTLAALVTSTQQYVVSINIRTTALGASRSAGFRFIDIAYDMPALDRTL